MQAIVVGAGVSGLSSAIRLLEAGFDVHILARDLPQKSTSAAGGAIWHPFSAIGNEQMLRWCRSTYRTLEVLARDDRSGVMPLLLDEPLPFTPTGPIDPVWHELVPDLEPLPPEALPPGYTNGIQYRTYLIETPIYLLYLLGYFHHQSGTIEEETVDDLDALTGPDRIVVNCTGAWAGPLTSDDRIYPIRGQIVRLEPQPELKKGFFVSGGPLGFTYILPRGEDCVLGGTHEDNVWSLEPDPTTSRRIQERCFTVMPWLSKAEILEARVGLRPGRDSVRLELEERANGPVIHNYGHGGIGYTLSWGCARDVAALARDRRLATGD